MLCYELYVDRNLPYANFAVKYRSELVMGHQRSLVIREVPKPKRKRSINYYLSLLEGLSVFGKPPLKYSLFPNICATSDIHMPLGVR